MVGREAESSTEAVAEEERGGSGGRFNRCGVSPEGAADCVSEPSMDCWVGGERGDSGEERGLRTAGGGVAADIAWPPQ